jgi:nitric oxide reductase subunit B
MRLDEVGKPAEHCANEFDVLREGTMADTLSEPLEPLSSWWRVAGIATMAAGFAVLILLTVKAYQNAPPIPDKFVDPAGALVFSADDVIAGQQVFLKARLDG